jgi:precorrin-6B methylase 2
LNKRVLDSDVQEYISSHLTTADVYKIALAKSPFPGVSAPELAGQIAAKNKCIKKLPSWFQQKGIYYPALLSVEQCSSEVTAQYKSSLALAGPLIDLTGGFGIDSHYFAKTTNTVTHCEINQELSEIAAHNASVFGQTNMQFLQGDGLEYLANTDKTFDTIYIDPARRGDSGKVFMLKDCIPNVVSNLDLMLSKTKRIIIKTAPLLDITAGLKELSHVVEVHILSVRNEAKELLWIIDKDKPADYNIKIIAVTLNDATKQFSFYRADLITEEDSTGKPSEDTAAQQISAGAYLYEPDAALMKSGAFDLIADKYKLKKLDRQTQLYFSETINTSFPGRIFKINNFISATVLKKQKGLTGNVIVRNYPDKAENLVKRYRIKPDSEKFLIFTHSKSEGHLIIDAQIIQRY